MLCDECGRGCTCNNIFKLILRPRRILTNQLERCCLLVCRSCRRRASLGCNNLHFEIHLRGVYQVRAFLIMPRMNLGHFLRHENFLIWSQSHQGGRWQSHESGSRRGCSRSRSRSRSWSGSWSWSASWSWSWSGSWGGSWGRLTAGRRIAHHWCCRIPCCRRNHLLRHQYLPSQIRLSPRLLLVQNPRHFRIRFRLVI